MLKAPRVGGKYWIVTDLWEVFSPVPVTIIAEDDGVFTGRWEISEEYAEVYEELSPEELFSTEREAWAAINERSVEK